MVSLFHTEDELYFSIEIPQIFVDLIQPNKTIQFYVIRDHASRPISDPDFFLTRCAHYSDILTPK